MNEAIARFRQMTRARAQRVQLQMLPDLLEGAGSLYDLPDVLKEHEINCTMIVTTKGFVKRGMLAQFLNDLLARGITSAVFSDVSSDPDFDCVQKAAAFYRSRSCDAIVAIGGGSVIDCAKVAGALVVRPGKSAADLVGSLKVRKELPLLVAVPTTAGTGSEATALAVIADPAAQRKCVIRDLVLIPNIAVLDSTLLTGLSPQ